MLNSRNEGVLTRGTHQKRGMIGGTGKSPSLAALFAARVARSATESAVLLGFGPADGSAPPMPVAADCAAAPSLAALAAQAGSTG